LHGSTLTIPLHYRSTMLCRWHFEFEV